MTEEFEDREKGLGDLPADLQELRGETSSSHEEPPYIPPGPFITGRREQGIPLDIERESRRQVGSEAGLGSPPRNLSTTTVWDARPMNARDFLRTGTDDVQFANGGPAKKRAEFSYTVPEGFTGVWRTFSYTPNDFFVAPPGNTLEFTGITTTLLINNIAVADYSNIQLGQEATDKPCFVIGNGGDVFTLRIDITDAYLSEVGEATYLFTIYGQNLLTRGFPKEFEVASQYQTGSRG